jgi:hypothetical protein
MDVMTTRLTLDVVRFRVASSADVVPRAIWPFGQPSCHYRLARHASLQGNADRARRIVNGVAGLCGDHFALDTRVALETCQVAELGDS